jgi:hypothetical protein
MAARAGDTTSRSPQLNGGAYAGGFLFGYDGGRPSRPTAWPDE